MRKIKAITITTLIIFAAGTPVFGRTVGKALGNYYLTEIKAMLNDKNIDSYNIGGKTLICLEDLESYGFNFSWDPENKVVKANTEEYEEKSMPDFSKTTLFRPSSDLVDVLSIYPTNYVDFNIDIGFYGAEVDNSYDIGGYYKRFANGHFFPIFDENGNDISYQFNYRHTYCYQHYNTEHHSSYESIRIQMKRECVTDTMYKLRMYVPKELNPLRPPEFLYYLDYEAIFPTHSLDHFEAEEEGSQYPDYCRELIISNMSTERPPASLES